MTNTEKLASPKRLFIFFREDGFYPLELPEATVAENARLRKALGELAAVVRGECPSLLNEDSGGDGALSIEIDDLLSNRRLSEVLC